SLGRWFDSSPGHKCGPDLRLCSQARTISNPTHLLLIFINEDVTNFQGAFSPAWRSFVVIFFNLQAPNWLESVILSGSDTLEP
ncbi:MAG: hypothetical protein WBX27_14455, partial [Specibacter sp.]